MKILLVSMASLHFLRWTEQLSDSGHELFWFDIRDSGRPVKWPGKIDQRVGWKRRWDFPGRFLLKKNLPRLSVLIQKINERDTAKSFEKYLKEVKPDVVHSFALYVACEPIFKVMQRYSFLPWIYSSWGSDLFFYKERPEYLEDIKMVLPRTNYMFSDCQRDVTIARSLGFEGKLLGVLPGGGGWDLSQVKVHCQPFEKRRTVLIKGFEGRSGRASILVQALKKLRRELDSFSVAFFGTSPEFHAKLETETEGIPNVRIYKRIGHSEVLKLMGQSFLYIGNSISDGIPNTLLEAIVMGAFPIQSNPGNATAEIIEHRKNGLLIGNPEDPEEIVALIKFALENPAMVRDGISHNYTHLRPSLEREILKSEVLEKYKIVEQDLLS